MKKYPMFKEGTKTKNDIYYVPKSVPENVIQPVKIIYREMINQGYRYVDMGIRSGVNPHTVRQWRTRYEPTYSSLEACLNVLGLTLAVKSLNHGKT